MSTLEAILDRLLPGDASPGAAALEMSDAVLPLVPGLPALLEELDDFATLSADDQDATLRRLDAAGDPVFDALVQAAHSVFYADPRSWRALGYTTHVPGRP
jgi:hypothetical protein